MFSPYFWFNTHITCLQQQKFNQIILNFQGTHWPQGAAAFPTMWRVGRFQNAHLPRATHNYSPTKGWAKACQLKRGQLGWQISGISFLPRVFGLYVETQNLKNPPQKAIVYIHIYIIYTYICMYTYKNFQPLNWKQNMQQPKHPSPYHLASKQKRKALPRTPRCTREVLPEVEKMSREGI